jgi:peroxiredoxin Q/BCP
VQYKPIISIILRFIWHNIKIKTMQTLKQGDVVPDFSSTDEQGNVVTLSDYKGKKLVVFFYPKASTPGCTVEACNLRDHYKELQAQGYELLGVSADSEKRQSNFKNKYEFPFPLLADEDKTVINTFGVWGPKKFMGKEYDGIHRMTFIINEQGVVDRVIEKVKTKDHAAQILG